MVNPAAPATASPSGTVQFLTNGVAMGGAVAVAGGAATISASTLPPGSNVVEAVYAGDSNFLPSTNSLVQVVNVEAQQPTTLGIRDNGDGSVTAVFSGTVGSQYLVQASSNLA